MPKLSPRETLRLLAIGIVAFFAVAVSIPDAIRIIWPNGVFGYATDVEGAIVRVVPDYPAAHAGLQVGDRVVVGAYKPQDRKPGLIGQAFTRDNPVRQLTVIKRDGVRESIQLEAIPEPMPLRIVATLRALIELVAVAVGALLLIARPSIATLGFYLFCLGFDIPSTVLISEIDNPWRIPFVAGRAALDAGYSAGLLAFALTFLAPWPRRVLWAIGLSCGALWLAQATIGITVDVGSTFFALPVGRAALASRLLEDATLIASGFAFIAEIVRTQGDERRRVGWIVVTFGIMAAARIAAARLYPGTITVWQYDLLLLTGVLPIGAVALSVLRRRVLDVDFAMSRGLVYVALAGALVAVFATIEEVFSYWFYNNTDLAIGFLVAISFVVSSGFSAVQQYGTKALDRLFMRERLAALEQLADIARDLPDVADLQQLRHLAIEETARLLELNCAALYERHDEGDYHLTASFHCDVETMPADLPRVLPIVATLEREREVDTMLDGTFFGETALRYGFKIASGPHFGAFAVYGVHETGDDLNESELGMLRAIAIASAVGFVTDEVKRLAAVIGVVPPIKESL